MLVTFITSELPAFLACSLTIILNIYLTIKASQVHKQIQEESKLSGCHTQDNDQLKALKKKQATIKKYRKPMITLLVVVLGNVSFGLLNPLLFIPTRIPSSLCKNHAICGKTQYNLLIPPVSSICLWTILQTSKRANYQHFNRHHL